MKLKIRNLKANEIKPAVAKANAGGAVLLLWKNNLADLTILDEIIDSTNYEIRYPQENVCCISIWDGTKKCFVSKEGIGEGISPKSIANDALRRAGTAWGIGRELFSIGELFVPKEMLKAWSETETDGKKYFHCYDEFRVLDVQYSKDNAVIVYLKIAISQYGKQHHVIEFHLNEDVVPESKEPKSGRSSKKTADKENAEKENVSDVEAKSDDAEKAVQDSSQPVITDDALANEKAEPASTSDGVEKNNDVEKHSDMPEKDVEAQSAEVKPLLADDEIILMGNCRNKAYKDVKDTPMFKSFLNWAKNSTTKYSDAKTAEQFARIKEFANIA